MLAVWGYALIVLRVDVNNILKSVQIGGIGVVA